MYVYMLICTYIHEPAHATRTRCPPARRFCRNDTRLSDFWTTRTSASGPIPEEDGSRFGKIFYRQIDALEGLER